MLTISKSFAHVDTRLLLGFLYYDTKFLFDLTAESSQEWGFSIKWKPNQLAKPKSGWIKLQLNSKRLERDPRVQSQVSQWTNALHWIIVAILTRFRCYIIKTTSIDRRWRDCLSNSWIESVDCGSLRPASQSSVRRLSLVGLYLGKTLDWLPTWIRRLAKSRWLTCSVFNSVPRRCSEMLGVAPNSIRLLRQIASQW